MNFSTSTANDFLSILAEGSFLLLVAALIVMGLIVAGLISGLLSLMLLLRARKSKLPLKSPGKTFIAGAVFLVITIMLLTIAFVYKDYLDFLTLWSFSS